MKLGTLRELTKLGDYIDYANVTDDAFGSNLFDSDVDPDKTYYIIALIISDTSGAANSATINEVQNDNSKKTIHANFNLGADETRVIGEESDVMALPPVDGGENIEVLASSDGVEVTALYFTDEV